MFVTLLNVMKLCIIGFTPKVQVIAIKHSISLIAIWCELLRSSKYNPPSGKRRGCLWHLRLWEGVFDVSVFRKYVFGVSFLGMDVSHFGRPSLMSSTIKEHLSEGSRLWRLSH